MGNITDTELVWQLRLAPRLSHCFGLLINEVFAKGMSNRKFSYSDSWSTVFESRIDLLKIVYDTYMLGKLFHLLGAKVTAVVSYPGAGQIVVEGKHVDSNVIEIDYDAENARNYARSKVK